MRYGAGEENGRYRTRTSIFYEMVPSGVRGSWLSSLEEIGMITTFAELHGYVKKPLPLPTGIHSVNIFLKESPIVSLLHC